MRKPQTLLPKEIDFGGLVTPTRNLPVLGPNYGEHCLAEVGIVTNAPVDVVIDTALHECLHRFGDKHLCLFSEAAREKDQHGIIEPLVQFLTTLFARNPFLVKWLLQAAIERGQVKQEEIMSLFVEGQ